MQYVLIKTTSNELPYTNKAGVYVIKTIIYTGIVGQTYNGFQNIDVGECPILQTDNTTQIQAKMDAFGTALISQKYPNT